MARKPPVRNRGNTCRVTGLTFQPAVLEHNIGLTIGPFLLDDMLQSIIYGLAEHLACPHFDEHELTRLHYQHGIRWLPYVKTGLS